MARNVNELIDALPARRRRRIERQAVHLIEKEMTLQELRRARKLTQAKMARSLGIAQKQISDVEKRTDMHLSTLRRTWRQWAASRSWWRSFRMARRFGWPG